MEQPLEIRVGYGGGKFEPLCVRMRSPGEDGDLAAGVLFLAGAVEVPEDLVQTRHCGLRIGLVRNSIDRVSALNSNAICVELRPNERGDARSDGEVGGTHHATTLADLKKFGRKIDAPVSDVDTELINSLFEKLDPLRTTVGRSSGLFHVGAFDHEGGFIAIREDIREANAMDKLIGVMFLDARLPMSDAIFVLPARVDFESVQKASMAGIPLIAGAGRPTGFAVERARELGVRVLGRTTEGSVDIF